LNAERLSLRGAGVTLAADKWTPAGAGTITTGRGTALLLHGGGQTRHSWRATGEELARAGWTAIAVDARGHGDSDWAPDGDYSIDALVADLRQVVATLPERPVLIGASMGGMTALIAEGEGPGTARGLVLVDITPRVEPKGAEEITSFMRSGIDGFDSADDALAAVVAYNPHRARPPRPEGLYKNLRRRGDRWYWHWDPRLLDAGDEPSRNATRSVAGYERSRAAAAAIAIPTMLVKGVQSNVVSAEGAAELLALIPGSELAEVSEAGHMVAGDDNHIFSKGLIDFLDRRITTG